MHSCKDLCYIAVRPFFIVQQPPPPLTPSLPPAPPPPLPSYYYVRSRAFLLKDPFGRLVCADVVLIKLDLPHAEELWCVGRLVVTAPSRLRRNNYVH